MTKMNLDVTRRRAAPAVFAALLPALVSLPLFAGCATDEPATETATQGLGASCTVWRPIAWSGVWNYCHEGTFPPYAISLQDGDSARFFSVPGPGLGEGEVRIICNNGVINIDPWDDICIPDQGGGDGGGF